MRWSNGWSHCRPHDVTRAYVGMVTQQVILTKKTNPWYNTNPCDQPQCEYNNRGARVKLEAQEAQQHGGEGWMYGTPAESWLKAEPARRIQTLWKVIQRPLRNRLREWADSIQLLDPPPWSLLGPQTLSLDNNIINTRSDERGFVTLLLKEDFKRGLIKLNFQKYTNLL